MKIFSLLKEKVMGFFFLILSYLIKTFFKKPAISGIENLQNIDPPFIFISNHALSYAPIITYLFLPYKIFPWVIYFITEKYLCRQHLEKDFVKKELKISPPFSNFIASLLEFFVLSLMKYINAIPVYKNSKNLIKTFKLSIKILKSKNNIIIFPEQETEETDYQKVQKFDTGFVKLGSFYYEETKKDLPFVPLAVNKKSHSIKIGKPVFFNHKEDFLQQKRKIVDYLRNEITKNLK